MRWETQGTYLDDFQVMFAKVGIVGIEILVKADVVVFAPLAHVAVVLHAPNSVLRLPNHEGRLLEHAQKTISA